jgi:molecular chaperone HtpG
LQKSLDEHVKEVRLTNRLTDSPACLVGAEMDYSPQMERLLQMGKGGGPKQRRILELNPRHEVFKKMLERFQNDKDASTLGGYGELLLGLAFLAEGSDLPDPVSFNSRAAELIAKSLDAPRRNGD